MSLYGDGKWPEKETGKRTTVLYPIIDLDLHGAQHQLLELVRGLDKVRFKPVVLNFTPGSPMEPYFRELPDVQLISLERKGKYDFLCLFKMMRILRKLKVEVIQPFLTPATFFSLLPAILCRTPVKIATERSVPVTNNTGIGFRLYLMVENYLARFADWAVANSQAGKEYLVARGVRPSRVKVIYNGIDTNRIACDNGEVQAARQRLNLPAGSKVVGMIARMFNVKRHDAFLRAAEIVNRLLPETVFVLLGDGPKRKSLESMSQELGLASKVVFLGEQQNVLPYLANFDVFALYSETEGLSLSICEAMALGKPVVATDVGGNRELVEDVKTGFLVPLGDTEAFAESIIRLLKDPGMVQSMGQKAREKVAGQLGLGRYVSEYQNLYDETLRRKRDLTVG
jgi:glycosyltransferase involved in cell wall biosynthesis